MKKRLIFTLFFIAIITSALAYDATPAPTLSPTPSPSPTTSPSPITTASPSPASTSTAPATTSTTTSTTTTTCTGEATYIVSAKAPIDSDNSEEVGESLAEQLTDDGNLKDFEACSYPASFSCSQPPCKVVLTQKPQIVVSTPDVGSTSSNSNTLKRCVKEGRIKVYELFAPDLESLIKKAMNQMQDITAQTIKDCSCPVNSATIVSITITSMSPITLFSRQVGFAVDYKIEVNCVALPTDSTQIAGIYYNTIYKKECVLANT